MSKYTKPIPLDELPETPAVYGEMIEEYNETKKTVSRDIEVEGLGKGRLVLSNQNKGKPFFYADEANIEANQKTAKQLQTAETVANLPLILAPFFTIAKGGQRIIKQRKDNQIKKSALAAEDLDKVKNVIDLVKSRATGVKPIIPTKTTAPTQSIQNLYKGNITPQQKKILSTIVLKQGTANDIESYGFGPEGPRGGATDAQIMQAYREATGELDLDPNTRGQGTLDVKGSEGARVNPRFDYGEDVLANTPPENVKLLADLGLNNDQAVFLLSNYDKADISRDASAAIQSLYTTVKEFNDTKDLALPYFLRGMKGIQRSKTPELDHIAQLKASLPFFNNARVSQFPEITRIILEEGVYGLGHQRGNFKYLEFDVHTVKSNFFKNKVGANGEIFFKNRDISTPDKLRAAAKEYAKIIDESNNVVADAIEQYKFMNKKDITEAELDEFVDILGNQPIRRKYSIMQIRNIFKQMEEDGFLETAKQTQKVETEQIKAEQKELARQQRLKKQLDKDAASVEARQQQMESFLNENLDTFNVNPYPLGMKDEALREAAEDTYRLFKENQLAIEGNVQRSLFEAEEREKFIKVMMKSILNRVRRDIKKKK